MPAPGRLSGGRRVEFPPDGVGGSAGAGGTDPPRCLKQGTDAVAELDG